MYGRCDPCSEREPGTGRLRREQAPVPCTPAMASDHRQSREHATTQRAGPHEDPLTASSGAALRREGDGTPRRVPGSDHPQSSHVLYGTSEGFILLVPTRFTEFHLSSPVPSMCLRAKDHLEGTKVAVFPRYCAEQQSPDWQRSGWRPPRSGDQEDDGRPDYPKRSRRPRDTS